MDIVNKNISNVTSLWMAAASAFQSYHQKGTMHYCYVSGSEWPNRMWCNGAITEADIPVIKEISKGNNGLSLSHFVTKEEKQIDPEEIGFQTGSEQSGMSLPLKHPFEVSLPLQFREVSDEETAWMWSNTFQKSFGYTISPAILMKTYQAIPWSLVYDNGRVVGTVILYQTSDIAGIHSLGVIPEMRRKGYAKEIMHHVLNQAIRNGAESAALQASKMAEEMYRKMGFSLDFVMKNYRLKTK